MARPDGGGIASNPAGSHRPHQGVPTAPAAGSAADHRGRVCQTSDLRPRRRIGGVDMRHAESVPRRFQNHPRHRTRMWAAVVCAALVCGVAACSEEPRPPVRVDAPPDPSVVREVVAPSGLTRHLEALQAAADANGGNRADATGGYEASAEYVEEQLRAAGYQPRRQEFSYGRRNPVDAFNILADSGSGSGNVLVLGAHLDSVEDGPGLNDNGSGVAAVLEVALRLAEQGAVSRDRIRFAFWGGEEDGMHGSEHYVEELSGAEAAAHVAYLNVDVVGSPNAVAFVYDGDGSDTEEAGPEGSGAVEQVFVDILRGEGVEALPFGFIEDSDYDAFVKRGIPAGACSPATVGPRPRPRRSRSAGRPGTSTTSATTRPATPSRTSTWPCWSG